MRHAMSPASLPGFFFQDFFKGEHNRDPFFSFFFKFKHQHFGFTAPQLWFRLSMQDLGFEQVSIHLSVSDGIG